MTNQPNLIWKPIPGWIGYYSISNLGDIKAEGRIVKSSFGRFNKLKERIIKIQKDGKGYLKFMAFRDGKGKGIPIHQALMWTFVGVQKKGIEVRHLDGNKLNNSLSNLKYGTKSDNMQDAISHGTFPLHERRPGSKLTRFQAIEIAKSTDKIGVIAKKFRITGATVIAIKERRSWKDFTEGIVFYKKRIPRKFSEEELKIIFDRSRPRSKICEQLKIDIWQLKSIRRNNIALKQ